MEKLIKSLLLSALILGLAACDKRVEEASTVNNIEAAVESGVSAMSGIMDDQNGSTYAMKQTPIHDPLRNLNELLFPKAYAANCARAVAQACNLGVKQATYDDCSGSAGLLSLDGQVTLTYSNMACTMANVGDNVVRTYNYTISGPRGGVVTNSSDIKATYDGTQLSGGAKLEKTATGHEVTIFGKHKSFVRNERELYDVSIETGSPLQITGGLARGNRQVTNGSLKVYHNIAEFTAEFTANNLGWSSSCCHPVSGSLSVSYEGSITGTASITFNSCGEATHEKDGLSQELTLSYCE